MEDYLKAAQERIKETVKDILIKRIKNEKKIFIGDTTLRDGEQAPGAGMNTEEKLTIAKQLDKLGVDSIEAGFPASSREDFEAVKAISLHVRRPVITALCRSRKEDIDCAKDALSKAGRWGLALFLGTSPILRKHSLGDKTKEEVLRIIKEAISYGREFTDNIAFGPEDASRTELEFLYEVYKEAIEAGALVVGFPDTVGCLVPSEVEGIISKIKTNVPNIDKAFLAVHFHNDLGLAVANTLAAIKSGVSIVQCTINGIGERAGNTSLEEVVMALETRQEYYRAKLSIKTEELYKTSRLVSEITGLGVAANKPIVGENVFATEAGIHQAALLKNRSTYEIIKPQDVGQAGTRIVLGRHSGKHAIIDRLHRLGYKVSDDNDKDIVDEIYKGFKELALTKKEVKDEELEAIAKEVFERHGKKVSHFRVGSIIMPHPAVYKGGKDKVKNLVTGATGFIGSFIAEELVKRGEHVRALARKTSNVEFLKKIGAEIFYGDLTDADSVRKAAKGVDKIFHSAAMVGDWMPKEEAFKTNVGGTRCLLETALNENVKRFVYVSSLAVLGMRDHDKTPSNPPADRTGDVYADTKIDSEKLVSDFGKKHNLAITIIRPGFVFGPRDYKVIPRMIDFIKQGKYVFIGSGKNKINMIYIENLTDAIIKASYSDKAVGQVYNITNDSGMTMKDLAYMVSDIWGFKRPQKHLPKNVAYMLCNVMEFFARATKAKRAPLLNKTRLKFLSLNLDFDITKIKEELGYNPRISMEDGLKRTKRWIEEEAKI